MGLNWKFQRGGGIQTKKPSVGGVWEFSGTTHSENDLGCFSGSDFKLSEEMSASNVSV